MISSYLRINTKGLIHESLADGVELHKMGNKHICREGRGYDFFFFFNGAEEKE